MSAVDDLLAGPPPDTGPPPVIDPKMTYNNHGKPIPLYENRTLIKRIKFGHTILGSGSKQIADIGCTYKNKSYSTPKICVLDFPNIHDLINKYRDGKDNKNNLYLYTHDDDPDNKPLLVAINYGQYELLLYKYGTNKDNDDDKNNDNDNDNDDNKENKEDYSKIIPMVKSFDLNGNNAKINILDYKNKKCDGVLSYLMMICTINMCHEKIFYSYDSSTTFSSKEDPFKDFRAKWKNKYTENQKEFICDEISTIILEEKSNLKHFKKLLECWKKLNGLEKKVFLLEYCLFAGSDEIKFNQKLNINEMSKNQIDHLNNKLNKNWTGKDGMDWSSKFFIDKKDDKKKDDKNQKPLLSQDQLLSDAQPLL